MQSNRLLRLRRAMDRLLEIMARLRAPNGCAWDREQTPATLKPQLLEEVYEVLEAIDTGSPGAPDRGARRPRCSTSSFRPRSRARRAVGRSTSPTPTWPTESIDKIDPTSSARLWRLPEDGRRGAGVLAQWIRDQEGREAGARKRARRRAARVAGADACRGDPEKGAQRRLRLARRDRLAGKSARGKSP